MDTIKEIFSQKFGSASDVIKANSEAEAKELKIAKERIDDLERAVSDMRRLSLKCAETNEITSQLVQGTIEKLEADTSEPAVAPELLEKLNEASEKLEALKQEMEESFRTQEETIHKENVRVYRNVQASIIDELKQQSEAIAAQHSHIEKRIKGIKPISIIALVFSGINLVVIAAAVVLFILSMGL